ALDRENPPDDGDRDPLTRDIEGKKRDPDPHDAEAQQGGGAQAQDAGIPQEFADACERGSRRGAAGRANRRRDGYPSRAERGAEVKWSTAPILRSDEPSDCRPGQRGSGGQEPKYPERAPPRFRG